MPSHSSSLLNELKDIASEAAEREKSQPRPTFSNSVSPIPRKTSSKSSSFSLSDALADVHGLVEEEARAEQKRREQSHSLRLSQMEASRAAEERQRQAEIQARIDAEDERRKALAEDKRLAKLRADYEAALARGEDVEMPKELRPPESTVPPQALTPPSEDLAVQAPAGQRSRGPLIMGGIAVCVAVAAVVYALIPPPPPPPELKPAPNLTAATVIKETKSEAELLREKIEANLKLERERKAREAEEAAKKAALAAKKTKRRKKKKKKKPGLNLNLDTF